MKQPYAFVNSLHKIDGPVSNRREDASSRTNPCLEAAIIREPAPPCYLGSCEGS